TRNTDYTLHYYKVVSGYSSFWLRFLLLFAALLLRLTAISLIDLLLILASGLERRGASVGQIVARGLARNRSSSDRLHGRRCDVGRRAGRGSDALALLRLVRLASLARLTLEVGTRRVRDSLHLASNHFLRQSLVRVVAPRVVLDNHLDFRIDGLLELHAIAGEHELGHLGRRETREGLLAVVVDLPRHVTKGVDVGLEGERLHAHSLGSQPSDGHASLRVHLVRRALTRHAKIGDLDL
ncbi:hypothetical protein PFISCL1PPCAC_23046, partial [Pristionchus fissidentatus]